MQTIEGFDFFHLAFDADGRLTSAAELDLLKQQAAAVPATDAIVIAHGFRNDEQDATRLYTNFLKTWRAHLARPEFQGPLGGRRFVVAGVFWPSMAFRESFDASARGDGGVQGVGGTEAAEMAAVKRQLQDLKEHAAAPAQAAKMDQAIALLPSLEGRPKKQDEFVALVLSLLDHTTVDPTEGAQQVRAQSGSELLEKLGPAIILPTQRDDDEGGVSPIAAGGPAVGGGAQGVGAVFGSIFGHVGQFLNLTTWYVMKDRSGKVGSAGVADAVRALGASQPALKLHLVGHSLGGRLMAACAKSLCTPPMLKPDSLTLLEAAFSHYGFSANNGKGTAGFFRDVVAQHVVKGPIVATFSFQDTVVGYAYAIMSRLAGDNVRAIGDAGDPFGGIGRNGTQKTAEAVTDVLHAVGLPYDFPLGVVNNLDGSGGLIKNHGDVTNENVTYAFAASVATT